MSRNCEDCFWWNYQGGNWGICNFITNRIEPATAEIVVYSDTEEHEIKTVFETNRFFSCDAFEKSRPEVVINER